jgi:alpha-amylase/alpha-mannosidase (GH57 family)
MSISSPLDRTYWDVYKELNKLADAADKALDNYPVGSNEWYKAWGYAEGMRQACIQSLERND